MPLWMTAEDGKSKALQMLLERHDKLNRRTGRFDVVCFGSKRHYRKDGSCMHVEAIVHSFPSRYIDRVYLSPSGGKDKPTFRYSPAVQGDTE